MKNRGSWFVACGSWIARDPDRVVVLGVLVAAAISVVFGWIK